VIVRWGLPDIESIQPIRACRSSEVVVVSISDGGRYAVGVLTVAMGLLVPTGVGWAASAGAAPAGVPTQLAITTQPPSTLLFNQPFTIGVSVEDSSGNLVTSDNTDEVSLTEVITSGGSAISCTENPMVVTAGVADFNCTRLSHNGTYQLVFGSGSLTPATTEPFALTSMFPGYWMTGSDGGVFAFGDAPYEGSLPGAGVTVNDIVGMAATPTGRGYWMVGADGGVFAFGDAPFLGSLPGDGTAVRDIVGIATTPNGNGYWLVGANGAVYPFGISRFEGSLPDSDVTVQDIVGMAATPTDMGYWLVGADGGVFAFGDAPFLGSMVGLGQRVTNAVGIAGSSGGAGYWVATAAGAVAGFGAAGNFPGSPLDLNAAVSSIIPTFSEISYWLFGKDGGVFAYGGAPYEGSLPGLGVHVTDIVGSAAL
jgi:hypothetical protein